MRWRNRKSQIAIARSQIPNPGSQIPICKSQISKSKSHGMIGKSQIPFCKSEKPIFKSQISNLNLQIPDLKSLLTNPKSHIIITTLQITNRDLPDRFQNPKSKMQIANRKSQIPGAVPDTEVCMRSKWNLKRLIPWAFRKSQIPNPKCKECGWAKGTHWLYCDQCLADVAQVVATRKN